jgi:hypothetical protein
MQRPTLVEHLIVAVATLGAMETPIMHRCAYVQVDKPGPAVEIRGPRTLFAGRSGVCSTRQRTASGPRGTSVIGMTGLEKDVRWRAECVKSHDVLEGGQPLRLAQATESRRWLSSIQRFHVQHDRQTATGPVFSVDTAAHGHVLPVRQS